MVGRKITAKDRFVTSEYHLDFNLTIWNALRTSLVFPS